MIMVGSFEGMGAEPRDRWAMRRGGLAQELRSYYIK